MISDLLKNNEKKLFVFVFGLTSIVFLYFILNIENVVPIWENFWDQHDYWHQSRMSLLSLEFFAPKPVRWFTPRPFTVPLFYKLAGSEPVHMFYLQKIMYCFACLFFTFSISKRISNLWLKIISVVLLLYYFTWWTIVGWSDNILSESLSFSLFLFWIVFVWDYYEKQNYLSLFILCLVGVLLSFTRDTWPYLITFFYSIILIFQWIQKRKIVKTLMLIAFSIMTWVLQSNTARIGDRSILPVFNNLAGRIAKDDSYLKWFEERGMPQADQLRIDFHDIEIDNQSFEKPFIYTRYEDSTYTELLKWIKLKGKRTYQIFLVTHPGYSLLNDQTSLQLDRIFAIRLESYYGGPQKFFHNADNVFPIFNVYTSIILSLLCFAIWIRTGISIYLLPFLILVFTIAYVILSYNADSMEVKRHLYMTEIIKELFSLISIVLLIQYAWMKWTKNRLEMMTGFKA